jgi:hypothetical protein
MPLAASDTVVATEADVDGEADGEALGDEAGIALGVGAGAHAVNHTTTAASRREHRDTRIITAETPQVGLEFQRDHGRRLRFDPACASLPRASVGWRVREPDRSQAGRPAPPTGRPLRRQRRQDVNWRRVWGLHCESRVVGRGRPCARSHRGRVPGSVGLPSARVDGPGGGGCERGGAMKPGRRAPTDANWSWYVRESEDRNA